MFTFMHSNFEWKHSNLRLRLYLWSKIIDIYKMIAKILWPLIQVNLPLMFYINAVPISSQLYRKRLYDFFYRDFTAFHELPFNTLFSVTQHHEKRWYPPISNAWRNYWTAPVLYLNKFTFLFILFNSAAGNYMFKVYNRNIRTRCEICSKLIIKASEQCHWSFLVSLFGVVLVSLLLNLNMFHTLLLCFYC